MRRLDLHPRKKLRNPDRHLRALRRWADRFHGVFPTVPQDVRASFAHWKLPAPAKLYAPDHTTPAIVSACLQCLIDAAAHVHRSRPDGADFPVVALIPYPDLWEAEVTVFFDRDYFTTFLPPKRRTGRVVHGSYWTETGPAATDLVTAHRLRLPGDFRSAGYHLTMLHDPETGRIIEEDRFVIGWW